MPANKKLLVGISIIFLVFSIWLPKKAFALDTGFLTAGANAAVTTNAGDNNGFEAGSGNTGASDDTYATSTDSGTAASIACSLPNASSDQHDFYDFGFSVPATAIDGVEVTTEARYSANAGTNTLCVFLSWDNGITWTAGKNTPDINTADVVNNLGGSTDTWGRAWVASEFNNGNFKVRAMTLVSNVARDASLDYLAVKVYYTLPYLEQSGYRWFRNTDSPDLISFTSNPSSSADTAYGMALDKTAEILYVVGTDGSLGDNQWKIERRSAKTSFLRYATTSNPSSGNDQARDVVLDNNETFMYIVGFDSVPGNREWRIEKRKARTGALVYSVLSNPSDGADQANAVAFDAASNAIYVVGTDLTAGDPGWRIEKRDAATGNLSYFVSENHSTSTDSIKNIAIDSSSGHMYLAGQSADATGDILWRIEKRNLSDGSLVFATTTNPSSGEDVAEGIAIASTSLIVVGHDRVPGDRQWRIEKRDLTDGALTLATTTNPTGAGDFLNDVLAQNNGLRIYLVGEESGAWRIEKRFTSDLTLQTAFGTDGVVTSDPSAGNDVAYAVAFDNQDNRLYVAGQDMIPGDAEWRVERRDTADGKPIWGKALNSLNTSSTFPARRNAVRLRMLIHIATSTFATSSQSFKLQYAQSSGVCDTGFSGETYVDVLTSAGDVRFMSNLGVAGGAAALPNFRDPTHSGDNVAEQTYVDSGTFSSITTIPVGEDGLWDFALQNYSAPAGATFCFRIVKSDGTLLDTYSQIPEITTSASLASASDQVFEFGQATTTAEAITVTASIGEGGAITTSSDIRIKIDGADAKMEWDTTKTAPALGGSASGKVSGAVSYPDAKTLLMDVTSDFLSGDTLTISDLAFTNFTGVNAAEAVLKLFVDGAADNDDDDNNDKTIAVKGKVAQNEHSSQGLISNKFDISGGSVSGESFFGFKLNPEGEEMDLATTTIDLVLNGFSASNISNAKLYLDLDGDSVADADEPQLGANGTVSVSNGTGTITFLNAGTVTTTRDIIVTADVSGIDEGDYMVFAASRVFAKGAVSKEFTNGKGSVSHKNHAKPQRGRVGGGPPGAGGAPPAGVGQGGGGPGGGAGGEGEPPPPGGGEGGGGAGGGDEGAP